MSRLLMSQKLFLAGMLLWSAQVVHAAPTDSPHQAYKADNTGINRRDRDERHLTPQDQRSNSADTELVAKVRRGILEIDSLSYYGRNVKILAQNNIVTLRGPVRDEQEKNLIEQRVKEIAAPHEVRSEIQIARNN